ncbi:MAG: DUF2461 domain-containing protein [Deltaproteobacteria bacterium]|nr:DUF2461 domain-containing protein [Deltaproteobacteria bacterium]
MKKPAPHFRPALFQFLRELAVNNDRTWFAENKARYEADVKGPLLSFIADFGPHLKKISRHYVADPRPVGGSLFRIHRDTRFSKDKTPYKTHASAQFRHEAGKDVHAPGYYLHLEPGSVFFGCGLWHPEPEPLQQIRTRIAEDPKAWKKAIGAKAFNPHYQLQGESLKRPPKGFDPDHPELEAIKRKDFIGVTPFKERDALSSDFLMQVVERAKAGTPLMRFLSESIELPF